MLAEAGVSATVATGTFAAVMAAVALWPSLVAVIVAVPARTPVTRPLGDTVATAGALDAQVIARSVSAVPAESWGVAASCTVCPT
jgi:hypothetical protein